jgi:hypothetical protein
MKARDDKGRVPSSRRFWGSRIETAIFCAFEQTASEPYADYFLFSAFVFSIAPDGPAVVKFVRIAPGPVMSF